MAESGDLFGDRLTFSPPSTGDRVTRLAVGVPGEDAAATDSGIVQVVPVTNLAGERTWAQKSPGVPGGVDAGDRFGSSLAVITGPAEKALLIGVPDDVDNPAGMVNVIPFTGGSAPRGWVPGQGRVPAGGTVADERNALHYNPRIVRAEMLTDEPVRAGSRFVAEPKGTGARGQMTLEIVEYERPHRLHNVIRSSYTQVDGTLTFAATMSGTRLRWDWTMRLVGPMRVLTPVLMLLGPRWERRNWIDLKDYLEDPTY